MSTVQTPFAFSLNPSPLQSSSIVSSSCSSSSFQTKTLIPNLPSFNLLLGSCCIPKENDAKPLGDDAHFVSQDTLTFGVADGVGGWAKQGIDAGEYSRQLMSNALAALNNQLHGCVNLRAVLNQAYSDTTAPGSSTACILTLKGRSLHAINIGDSGFRIIRDGTCVYQSPVQQRGFNYPYQLGNASKCDDPSLAQLLDDIPLKDGDVVVAGTDGLFDNMFDSEIELEVQKGIQQGVSAQDMAYTIAELALSNSLDRFTPSPFARAAKMAGHKHRGGKIDDISVIVAYVVS